MAGYIKLYRDIYEHWIWKDKPFSRGQAWIDLLLMANHDDNKIVIGNEIVLVERGCLVTSEVKLSERWGWSRHKVRDFLNLLQNDSMITKKSDTKRTYINILNYSVWQDSPTAKEHQKDSAGTSKGQRRDTNKNVKNDKNEKKYIYTQIVDYLNQKAGTSYRPTTRKTQSLIDARLNEGFTVEDFFKVIDNKVTDWNHEPGPGEKDMRPFLRPETLFGTKFESYLNARPATKAMPKRDNFIQREYDDAFFERFEQASIGKVSGGGQA